MEIRRAHHVSELVELPPGRASQRQERAAQGLPPIAFTPRLKLATGEVYPIEGVIDYADNRVNPTTGTVTVTVT